MSVFDFNRIGLSKSGALLPLLTREIDYNDLERVDSVTTINLAGMPMKIVSHADIPSGEMHAVIQGRCVGKIINIK